MPGAEAGVEVAGVEGLAALNGLVDPEGITKGLFVSGADAGTSIT